VGDQDSWLLQVDMKVITNFLEQYDNICIKTVQNDATTDPGILELYHKEVKDT
jgi:hypothetical protein